MKLEPTRHILIQDETIAKILSLYAISTFTYVPTEEGISNTTLVIESNKKYILRIYAQHKSDKDIALEINFQDYLRTRGIPTPLIYPNNKGEKLSIIEIDGKRWQVILIEFIEGQNVTTHPSRTLLSELAILQAKMHLLGIEFSKGIPNIKYPLLHLHDSLTEKIKNIPTPKIEVADFIKRVKAYNYTLNTELPYGYNHLDIDFDGNVLTKDNKVQAIVDFGDLRYSPAIVCLGYSVWNILDDEGADEARFYLSEYEKIRPLTSLEQEALPHVIFFRNYVIGIIRLLLWDNTTPISDIQDILKLEKQIPSLTF